MTMMNGITLTGYTYSEVLELLSRMARPVRIKFADVSKGIVVRIALVSICMMFDDSAFSSLRTCAVMIGTS